MQCSHRTAAIHKSLFAPQVALRNILNSLDKNQAYAPCPLGPLYNLLSLYALAMPLIVAPRGRQQRVSCRLRD